nr:hypothetical protein CFP56_29286 [Quercus suber]
MEQTNNPAIDDSAYNPAAAPAYNPVAAHVYNYGPAYNPATTLAYNYATARAYNPAVAPEDNPAAALAYSDAAAPQYYPAAAPVYNPIQFVMSLFPEAGTSQDTDKMPTTFHMKKTLKLKQLKSRGKNKRKSSMPATEASVDAMVE